MPGEDINRLQLNPKPDLILMDIQLDDGLCFEIYLEQLQTLLDPSRFFRINSECIVNIDAITLMYSYSSGRLQLSIKNKDKNDLFIVSRDKVADF